MTNILFLGDMKMRNGRQTDFWNLSVDDDGKGEFVEYCLYDFFESSGHESALLDCGTNDNGDFIQRMHEDTDIIIPDIISQNCYKELMFIESKSRWVNIDKYPSGEIEDRKIKKKTYESYIRFNKEIFGESYRIMCPANVFMCFSTVRFSIKEGFGQINLNFVKFNDFINLRHTESFKNWPTTQYVWRESDLQEISHKNRKIGFEYSNNTFYTKYSNNVDGKQRKRFTVTNKSAKKLIQEWIYNI